MLSKPVLLTSTLAGRSLLFPQLPSSSLAVSVIVPVRNEGSSLLNTLESLLQQQCPDGSAVLHDRYEVLMLVNNCTDHSFRIASDFQLAHPGFRLYVAEIRLPPQHAHVGTVRRLLMDEACQRFTRLGYSKGIIASTDGDTQADSCWVFHLLEEFGKGYDAVGGRIFVNSHPDRPDLYHALHETYRTLIAQVESMLDPLEHDPWPRHYQYFGANLAVTSEMYQLAGRLPELPYLEDEAFHKALERRDAKIRRSPAVQVLTSGRQHGRVAVGLSEQLRKWSQMQEDEEPLVVTAAAETIEKIKTRGIVRSRRKEMERHGTYHAAMLDAAANTLAIDPCWLRRELEQSPFFGQLWESIEQQIPPGNWGQRWKPEPITQAIRKLKDFINRGL